MIDFVKLNVTISQRRGSNPCRHARIQIFIYLVISKEENLNVEYRVQNVLT